MVDTVVLTPESFSQLQDRGRSESFKGSYQKGQSIVAKCGVESLNAVIDRAGRASWVAKKPDA